MEPFVTTASIADVLESLLSLCRASTSLKDLNFAIHVLDLRSINRSVKILLGHHDV